MLVVKLSIQREAHRRPLITFDEAISFGKALDKKICSIHGVIAITADARYLNAACRNLQPFRAGKNERVGIIAEHAVDIYVAYNDIGNVSAYS